MNDLSTVDLQRLTALDALLRHRSVSNAARELGVAQPTMSHTLAQLRDAFGDPLLVRAGNRMVPTARAEALLQPLSEAIASLQRLGTMTAFDPAQAVGRLRIACTDYVAGVLMPKLVRCLREEAPNLQLQLQAWGQRRAPALASDELDLGIGSGSALPIAGLYRSALFDETFVCIADKNNRRAHGKLSPAQFAALPHLQLTVKGVGAGAVDAALAERDLSRQVVVKLAHFWLAADFVRGTDLVATVPLRLARALRPRCDWLKRVQIPFEVKSFSLFLLWHERLHRDPMHRWLRQRLTDSVRAPG